MACISTYHRDYYARLGARPEQLEIVYLGTDLERFDALPPRPTKRAGPPHILSVGRLVAKKGFGVLIDACRVLAQRGSDFRCTIAGSGPLESELRRQIDTVKLNDRVTVTGKPLLQEDLPRFLHEGDIFCLACVPAPDGDMDGLPITLMEALASGLPTVSTRLVGIPDLVINDKTGLLVEPNDAVALADALQKLMNDPALATRLAQAGKEYVHESFNIETCLQPLIDKWLVAK